ncbi:hypothetical protein BCR33DRAFT_245929 [Rhizoclosmatium globosum]|uniref:Uncharacterized protein n=1 Tax=Rhizoclosmatium globosum TaxID=329046 RepID=A0A1Y2C9R4_9FUNG|nr:hypothetical protein BCR33DRAFT_245929 [Rhizoclosmatium globosum]|eukprot:ORY43676.1 hypothetical protein BCR33DRAFT_245929 [Rhizoclosmatium globosum]
MLVLDNSEIVWVDAQVVNSEITSVEEIGAVVANVVTVEDATSADVSVKEELASVDVTELSSVEIRLVEEIGTVEVARYVVEVATGFVVESGTFVLDKVEAAVVNEVVLTVVEIARVDVVARELAVDVSIELVADVNELMDDGAKVLTVVSSSISWAYT